MPFPIKLMELKIDEIHWPKNSAKAQQAECLSLEISGKNSFPFWLLPRGKCIQNKLNVKTLSRPYTKRTHQSFHLWVCYLGNGYAVDTNWSVELGISNIANYNNSSMITVYLRWGWEEVVVGLAWLSVFACPGSWCSDGWIDPVVVTIRCQEGPKGEGRHAVDLRVIKGDFLRHSKGLSPLASHTGTRNVKTGTGCVTDWQSPSKDWID